MENEADFEAINVSSSVVYPDADVQPVIRKRFHWFRVGKRLVFTGLVLGR